MWIGPTRHKHIKELNQRLDYVLAQFLFQYLVKLGLRQLLLNFGNIFVPFVIMNGGVSSKDSFVSKHIEVKLRHFYLIEDQNMQSISELLFKILLKIDELLHVG